MRTILALLIALTVVSIADTAEATGGRRGFLRQRQVIVQPRQRIVVQQQRQFFAQPQRQFIIQQPQQLFFAQPIYTQPLVVPRQQIIIVH